MKKSLIIKSLLTVLILLVVFGLAACKTSEPDKPQDKPNESEQGGDTQKVTKTVTFNSNGGSDVASVNYEEGKKVSKPQDPTKEGASLACWCVDEELEEEFDFDKAPSSFEDFTLYAKWNVSIEFVVNGGKTIDSLKRDANDMLILPIAEDNSGRQFIGWYLDEELTNKVDSLFIVPNDPIKVYAKWASVEMGTAIDFLSGMVVNEPSHYELEQTDEGLNIKPTESKSTWSFVYSPINVGLSGYSVLHVSFKGLEDSSMIVKLEGGGVAAIEQKFIFTGEWQNEFWIIPEANIATEAGQRILIFVDGGKEGNDVDSDVTISALEFCKLKGTEEVADQAIIFNTNGGSRVDSITAPYDSVINMPNDPTKPGFSFAGWYLDEELSQAFTSEKMPMGPTTLYAKWVDAPTHSVTFVTNAPLSLDNIDVKEGLDIPATELEYLGWQFVGWYRNEELTDTNLIMGKTDTILYAKWKTLADLSDKERPYTLMSGWTTTEANAYTIVDHTDNFEVTATTLKGKWSLFSHELTDLDAKYINALHFSATAKEGASIIIKYNNKVEKKFTFASSTIDEWWYLTTPIDPSVKLMIFYAPNAKLDADEVITFTSFELLNPSEKIDHIDAKAGWISNDPGQYEIVENENETIFTATTSKTGWAFVKVDLSQIEDLEAKNIKKIELTFVGPVNHSMIVKYNNSKETKVFFTGEEQKLVLDVNGTLDFSINNHFIIFIDGGTTPEEAVNVSMKKIDLYVVHKEKPLVPVEYEYESVDFLKGWYSADAGAYEVEEQETSIVVTATTLKGNWSVLKHEFSEVIENPYSIKVKMVGPAGEAIIIKYNNAKEQKYIFTGEEQEVELVFSVDLDQSKPLYFFIVPGAKVDENVTVVFKSIEIIKKIEVPGSGEVTPVEQTTSTLSILDGWFSADAGAYEVAKDGEKMVVTATTLKGKWSVLKLPIDSMDLEGAEKVKISVTGPVGHTMIFKYNNAKEQKYEFTGEKQDLELAFIVALDNTKPLYIFIDGGQVLDEAIDVTFDSIELVITK